MFDISDYRRDGFVVLDGLFTDDEIRMIQDEADRMLAEDGESRTVETGTEAVRATHGNHRSSAFFDNLIKLPRLLDIAEELLGDQVYVHQFKINAKLGLVGDLWAWHQDYRFWRDEDGMPSPNALTIAVFLDEVHEFNGPLMLVPGSHAGQLIPVKSEQSQDWSTTLSADLKHQIGADALRDALRGREIVAPKGPAGTAIVFHSNILHGSGPNMSPDARRVLLVSYNAVENALKPVKNPRPEFLASRDFEAVSAGPATLLETIG